MGKTFGKPRILFLDIDNSIGSQLAEALLRQLGGARFLPFSAGLEPTQLDPLVSRVLEEIHIDTEGQQAKGLIEFWTAKHSFSYTITVGRESEAKSPKMFPFKTKQLFWPIETIEIDKTDRLEGVRRMRDQLIQYIQSWLPDAEDHSQLPRPF